jgi:glycosyltransferase involved in cell wall biosynthesis
MTTTPDQPTDQNAQPTEGQQPQPQQQQRHGQHQRPPRQQHQRNPQQSQREQREPREPRDQQQQQQQGWADISVVIPLYNEEGSLKELNTQLRSVLGRMNIRYEIVYVDDGSTDRSFQVLRDLKRNDRHIKVVRFRRNFGKSAALAVGFDKAQGNIVITMDADLQDDPAEIPSMKRRIEDGFDLISGWKKVRHDPITKTIPSKFFNKVTAMMTGVKIHDMNCGLKAYRKEVIKTVKVYGELHRYIPVLAHWEGFKVGEMVVQHRARKYGKTKFGLGRFWKGFLDLLTAIFTTRFLRRPLHLFGPVGILSMVLGGGVDAWMVFHRLLLGPDVYALGSRPMFFAATIMVVIGVQFISLGLLGEMISKTRTSAEEYSIREFLK